MGEIAEAYINGFYCQNCGEVIDDDEPGYPRNCNACSDEDEHDR